MKIKFSKTPLLIAAIATAVTLTSFGPASAGEHWVSADVETVEVVPANFKFKKFKHHGFKKKVYKPSIKKKALLKKKFF